MLCLHFIDSDTLFNSFEINVKVGRRGEASVSKLTVKTRHYCFVADARFSTGVLQIIIYGHMRRLV